MECPPPPELQLSPAEQILVELYEEIKDDWTAGGVKIHILNKLERLIEQKNEEPQ